MKGEDRRAIPAFSESEKLRLAVDIRLWIEREHVQSLQQDGLYRIDGIEAIE